MAAISFFFLFPSLFALCCTIKAVLKIPPPLPSSQHHITERKHSFQFRVPSSECRFSLDVKVNFSPFFIYFFFNICVVSVLNTCAGLCTEATTSLCLRPLWLALTLLLQLSASSQPQRKHWLLFYVKHVTVVHGWIVLYIIQSQ